MTERALDLKVAIARTHAILDANQEESAPVKAPQPSILRHVLSEVRPQQFGIKSVEGGSDDNIMPDWLIDYNKDDKVEDIHLKDEIEEIEDTLPSVITWNMRLVSVLPLSTSTLCLIFGTMCAPLR